MTKSWLGYLSSALFLFAGIFQIIGGSPKIGTLFIVLSIATVVLNIYIRKNMPK